MESMIVYCINGWKERKNYFLSFGFTEQEINEMIQGKTITKNGNTFSIYIEQ